MEQRLLFFDTFSHESPDAASSELNLDLVQFPNPVTIQEIRIIPLGARVHLAHLSQMGATNPAQFTLEFFVNDLGQEGASSFQTLGSIQYNQVNQIQLLVRKDISTDGLVLRGKYKALTIAVYGALSVDKNGNESEQNNGAAESAAAEEEQDRSRLATPESKEEASVEVDHEAQEENKNKNAELAADEMSDISDGDIEEDLEEDMEEISEDEWSEFEADFEQNFIDPVIKWSNLERIPRLPSRQSYSSEPFKGLVNFSGSAEWINSLEEAAKCLKDPLYMLEDLNLTWLPICLNGLDVDLALTHSKPIDIVRHMKAGTKFAANVFQQSFKEEALTSSTVHQIQERLVRMMENESIAPSIQIASLQAVLNSLDTKIGMEGFLKNWYAKILKFYSSVGLRMRHHLIPLINKVNSYELALKVSSNQDIEALKAILTSLKSGGRSASQRVKYLHGNMDSFPFYLPSLGLCDFLAALKHFFAAGEEDLVAKVLEVLVQNERGLEILMENADEANSLLNVLSEKDDGGGLAKRVLVKTNALNSMRLVTKAKSDRLFHLQNVYGFIFERKSRIALAEVLSAEQCIETLIEIALEENNREEAKNIATNLLLVTFNFAESFQPFEKNVSSLRRIPEFAESAKVLAGKKELHKLCNDQSPTAVRLLALLGSDNWTLSQLYSHGILDTLAAFFNSLSRKSSRLDAAQTFALKSALATVKNVIKLVLSVKKESAIDPLLIESILNSYSLCDLEDEFAEVLTEFLRANGEKIAEKSAWTMMLDRLINFTCGLPKNLKTGLTLLDQLLPERNGEFEDSCNLWSAHIIHLHKEFRMLLKEKLFHAYGCKAVNELRTSICRKIGNLSTPTAQMIAEEIIESLSECDRKVSLKVIYEICREINLKKELLQLLSENESLGRLQGFDDGKARAKFLSHLCVNIGRDDLFVVTKLVKTLIAFGTLDDFLTSFVSHRDGRRSAASLWIIVSGDLKVESSGHEHFLKALRKVTFEEELLQKLHESNLDVLTGENGSISGGEFEEFLSRMENALEEDDDDAELRENGAENAGLEIDLDDVIRDKLENFDLSVETKLYYGVETKVKMPEIKKHAKKPKDKKLLLQHHKSWTQSNRHYHHDGFRSRPPNTSRPPSLHVDDFLVLQQRGQQPTGPTGYNKQSIKAVKELFAQREAEKMSSLVGYREATKNPVYNMEEKLKMRSIRGGRGRGRFSPMGEDLLGDRRKWREGRKGGVGDKQHPRNMMR